MPSYHRRRKWVSFHGPRYRCGRKRLRKTKELEPFEMKRPLLPCQQEALQFLQPQRRGQLIQMPMGSGKTMVALALGVRHGLWPLLFLTPAPVVPHIQEQVDVSLRTIYHKHVNVVAFGEHVEPRPYQLLVVDECHLLLRKPRWVRQVRALASQIPTTIGLTGTLNIEPNAIARQHNILGGNDTVLRPFYGGIVPLTVDQHVVRLELSNTQRQEYDTIVVQNGMGNSDKLLRLRRLLSGYKANPVVEWIRTYVPPQLRIMVVSAYHLTSLRLALDLMLQRPIPRIENASDLAAFHANPLAVGIADRAVVGYGLDLGFVDVMILVEPTRHSDEFRQLAARLTRYGQKPTHLLRPMVVEFIYRDTAEDRIRQSHQPISAVEENLVTSLTHNSSEKDMVDGQ